MNHATSLAIVGMLAALMVAIAINIPAAYADNKNKAEDDSAAATGDCDVNGVEQAGFDCFGIAANDIEVEEEETPPCTQPG